MAQASYAVTNFQGGEVSELYQGRFDLPNYRTFLNVGLNGFPTEAGGHVRRPGSQWGGWTRGGKSGRVIKFDVQQATPYQLEFTDGHMRFWQGAQLVVAEAAPVLSVSGANPAVVNYSGFGITGPVATGDQVFFGALGTTAPLLQGRVFACTRINSTNFSIVDAVTGVTVDGSTIGALAAGAAIFKVRDVTTPYTAGLWANVRSVQAETQAVLLQGTVAPQILQFLGAPASGFANFSLAAASLLDGPYLDPFTNGAQVSPNQKTGIVTLTINFPAYVATTSYPIGAFITFSSNNYVSIVDQNVGNTPDISPSQWTATSANAAINGGRGFLGTDIGRLVRLYSIPAAWAAGTTYASGTVVSYNPTGASGAETFWQSQVGSNTGNVPGTDLTHWAPVTTGAALWTWGKIISLANQVAQGTGTAIGSMTAGGGIAAAFDSVPSKVAASSAEQSAGALSASGFVGKDYSGAGGSKVEHATLYPSTDQGFVQGTPDVGFIVSGITVVVNLRAKSTAPSSASDGTLLGTTGTIGNSVAPITIVSSDQTTTWNYVWFEIIGSITQNPGGSHGS